MNCGHLVRRHGRYGSNDKENKNMPICLNVIADSVIFLIIGFILKWFIPPYMKKKAENLATREDIQRVKRLTEEVKSEFKKTDKLFSVNVKFYDNQLNKLYSHLYACIAQSECIKDFLRCEGKSVSDIDAYPYLQISPTTEYHRKLTLNDSNRPKIEYSEMQTTTDISKMPFDDIIARIINNSYLAEPDLLKLALAYRLFSENHDGLDENDNEYLRHVEQLIVRDIVISYNQLREKLGMPFEKYEIIEGTIKLPNRQNILDTMQG